MARILFTGATGAFGSVLLAELTEHGHDLICLARAKDGLSACERVYEAAKRYGADSNAISVISGDVLEPHCGLLLRDRETWRGSIDMLLHCAASISFDAKDGARTRATNVGGVEQMLAMADDLGILDIRHISTAYVAGDADRFSEGDHYVLQCWRNIYEESKWFGETAVREWALRDPTLRRYTILRPSIIVGSAKDGVTPSFDAYYGFFKPWDAAANAVRTRAYEARELAPDVSVAPDGTVTMPIAVHASHSSTLNLIQSDWLARIAADCINLPPQNRVYHLVHPAPPKVADVIRWSLAALKIKGVSIVESEKEKRVVMAGQSKLAAGLQRRIDAVLNRYLPYVTHEPRFRMKAIVHDLNGQFTLPPPVDAAFLNRTLGYALRTNWGSIEPVPTAHAA